MIYHELRCVFVHVPKSAGTSVTRVLGAARGAPIPDHRAVPLQLDGHTFDPPPPHLRASDYVKYGLVTREQFDGYFKFAFVRNPWDRIVSEYKYRRHARRYSFKEFLFEHFPRPSWTDAYCHVIPQYDFLCDERGGLLVDFVGRFETLGRDFAHICATLGIAAETLPHANKSSSIFNRRDASLIQVLRSVRNTLSLARLRHTFASYVDYYDDESRDFVARLYARDLEAFGYTFGR